MATGTEERVRVLLVSGAEAIAHELADFLVEEGFSLKVATSVETAERLLAVASFDVLLLDCASHPDVGGEMLTRMPSAAASLRRVALTLGWTSTPGVQAVLAPPFDLDRLVAELERRPSSLER